MKPLCCLSNPSIPLVVDTSVAINLNATGCAYDVLRSLPHHVLMVDVAVEELRNGSQRADADLTSQLVANGVLKIVKLGECGWSHYGQLVMGSAAQTLGDGEAATIAFAVEASAMALLDERKASAICAERFADLSIASTVDLFTHPDVGRALGRHALATAVHNALRIARMNVQPHHLGWVVEMVGPENAAKCLSLPGQLRSRLALEQ